MDFMGYKQNSATKSSYINRHTGQGHLPQILVKLTTGYVTLGNLLTLSKPFFIDKLEIQMVIF